MVYFYLCNDFQYLWSNRLQANPHNNIIVNDINSNKPCTVKSKMNIYIGKNYKNYTLSLWVAQTSVYEKAMRFLKMLKGKTKRRGQRKLIIAASITIQIDNYALIFPLGRQADSHHSQDTRVRKCQQSTQSFSQFYRKSIYTKLQRGSLMRSAAHCT